VGADAGNRTIRLTLAYEGTAFSGWQHQPGARTIQGVLEAAFAVIEKRPVAVVAAGRTDAGVHARAQVVSAEVTTTLAPAVLRRALNVRLPPDVRVTDVADAPAGFNARREACGKVYHYTLALTDPDPFTRRVVWHVPYRLDVDAMQRAAPLLVGEHDFAAFQATGSDVATSIRTIRASVLREHPGPPRYLRYEVTGTGFLRHMVRNIVGTLVEVGRHRWPPEAMHEILASRNRHRAGATAPPQGLILVRVLF
jgi:tRNA pseudouridine38-40 synthase